jgi:hypothetical protein
MPLGLNFRQIIGLFEDVDLLSTFNCGRMVSGGPGWEESLTLL